MILYRSLLIFQIVKTNFLLFLLFQTQAQILNSASTSEVQQILRVIPEQISSIPLLGSTSATITYRKMLLEDNRKQIDQHNQLQDKTYQLDLNKYAILDEKEISTNVFTLIPSQNQSLQWANFYIQKTDIFVSSVSSSSNATIRQNSAQEASLENPVLNIIFDFLKQRNLSDQQIQAQISQYSYTGRRSSDKQQPNRLLQSTSYQYENQTQIAQLQNLSIDWTCMAGKVKDQGISCGSCYAFATTDAFSMLMAIYRYNFFVSTSVQQILECSKNSLTLGCKGGFLQGSYAYMIQKGIMLDIWYPYSQSTFQSSKLSKCRLTQKRKYRVRNFLYRPQTQIMEECRALRYALKDQPLAIGIAGRPLLFYKRGVFNSCPEDTRIDHAVVLIGYEYGKGWKIKNSWGTSWGENGFAWIGDGNTCNICQLFFTIEPSEPKAFENYIKKRKRVC